jgi:hypothetical protein
MTEKEVMFTAVEAVHRWLALVERRHARDPVDTRATILAIAGQMNRWASRMRVLVEGES